MKKRFRMAALVLSLVLCTQMMACGGREKAETQAQAETQTQTQAETLDSAESQADAETASAESQTGGAESAGAGDGQEGQASAETESSLEWAPSCSASDFQTEETSVALRIALADSADSVLGQACQKFADLLKEYSGGMIMAQVYADGTLFSESEMGKAVSGGYVQVTAGTPGPRMFKSLSIFAMPNIFSSMEYAHGTCDVSSDFRSLIGSIYERQGIQLLAMEPREYELLTSKKAVRAASEISGLRLGLEGDDIPMAYWKDWGAYPEEIKRDELYFGLQKDTIDAQVGTYQEFVDSGLAGMQQYVINTYSVLRFSSLMMNKDFYDSLTDNGRAIVKAAAKDAWSYCYLASVESQEKNLKAMTDAGMELINFEKDDKNQLRNAAGSGDAIVKQTLGENSYGRLMAALGY